MQPANPLLPELASALDATRGRGRFAVFSLGLMAGLEVLRMFSCALQYRLLQGGLAHPISEAAASANDTRHMALVVAALVATLLAAIGLARWVSRAYDTLPLMDSPPVQFTASQALWSFFIPFVNFVRPYQVVRDLYRVTDPAYARPAVVQLDAANYRQAAATTGPTFHAPTDAPIALWWGLWVASKVLARFNNQQPSSTLEGPALIEQLLRATLLEAAYSGMAIASALVAILVVLRIDARMRAHGQTMGAPVAQR
ncbi:MAG: DUF4328 domain-containing protein [Myxococcales bacterium]|nr:DUF4328 domain-containing protein [Myxococcales bacterium]